MYTLNMTFHDAYCYSMHCCGRILLLQGDDIPLWFPPEV